MFFNVCLHSRSFPLRADWRKFDSSVDKEPQGIGGGIHIPETELQALLPFPAPPPERPRELAAEYKHGTVDSL